jgi:hypothetical protein
VHTPNIDPEFRTGQRVQADASGAKSILSRRSAGAIVTSAFSLGPAGARPADSGVAAFAFPIVLFAAGAVLTALLFPRRPRHS